MKVKELRELLNRYAKLQPNIDEYEVGVVLSKNPIGGTPVDKVKSISAGFDWDSGKMMIYTENKLILKK